ncbi:MAG: S8/S53 family peptidase, partial [Candidatus Omnitrophica bacterium]|nr:S8/S53 family peptidase [Candidatus Omnitrophota bacterium]
TTGAKSGRLDKVTLVAADADGCLSSNYDYFTGTDRVQTKRSYTDNAWTTLKVTYAYQNDATNRVFSKTLVVADGLGNIYYEFKNEGLYGTDDPNTTIDERYGRLDKSKRAVADTAGCLSYKYFYQAGSGRISYKEGYADNNWTTLKATYYYKDEDFYTDATTGAKSGRLDKVKLVSADADGCLSSNYDYFTGTDRVQTKRSYTDNAWTTLKVTYVYQNDADNRISTKEVLQELDPNGNGIPNEAVGDQDSEFYNKHVKYYMRNAADYTGTDGVTYGRVTRIDNISDGYYYEYTYSALSSIRVLTKTKKDINTNVILLVYTYSDDVAHYLKKKEIYNAAGTAIIETDQYNSSGALLKKQLATADVYGNVMYEYYDEGAGFDFNNNGVVDANEHYGRTYKVQKPNGTIYTYEAYYKGTDLVAKDTDSTYTGHSYYFYKDYTIHQSQDPTGANVIGFRKELTDTNGAVTESFEYQRYDATAGNYRITKHYSKKEGRTYYYSWDYHYNGEANKGLLMYEDPHYVNVPGVFVGMAWGYTYPFDETSNKLNPTVDWGRIADVCYLIPGLLPTELGTWDPAKVEYPVAGNPAWLEIAGSNFVETPQENRETLVNTSSFYKNYDALKAETKGEGVTIAFLDTGFTADSVLKGNVVGGYDFAGSDVDQLLPDADYSDVAGHGTRMIYTVTGDNWQAVAPGANIQSLKVFDDSGKISTTAVYNAIDYAADNGAGVIVMPFSLYPINDVINEAIDYALSKNIIIIAAAGNEGEEINADSLAAQNKIITVGSVNADGQRASWSNYGSEVDLYAPWDVFSVKGDDGETAGTSYSAAFVAGIAALMRAENPNMTQDEFISEFKQMAGITSSGNTEGINYEALEAVIKNNEDQNLIKGVNENEVLSMQSAVRKNQGDFTGSPILMDVLGNMKNYNKNTLVPVSPFNPLVKISEKDGAYTVSDDKEAKVKLLQEFIEESKMLGKEHSGSKKKTDNKV